MIKVGIIEISGVVYNGDGLILPQHFMVAHSERSLVYLTYAVFQFAENAESGRDRKRRAVVTICVCVFWETVNPNDYGFPRSEPEALFLTASVPSSDNKVFPSDSTCNSRKLFLHLVGICTLGTMSCS